MPECYTCGCWIERGRGVRARVMTATSARYYATRYGGGSFGMSFGLRTICPPCAQRQSSEDFTERMIILVWCLALPAGTYALFAHGLVAAVTLGLVAPVLISWIIRSGAREDARHRANPKPGVQHRPASVAASLPVATRTLQTPSATWASVAQDRAEPDPVSWHTDDTTETWSRRVIVMLGEKHGMSVETLRAHIVDLSRWCTPKVGEGFRHWHSRAQERLAQIDLTCDPMSPASAIRPNETRHDWLIRVTLLCVPIGDTARMDDLLAAIKPIADSVPPRFFESALDWFERTRVRVDAALITVPDLPARSDEA